MSGDLCSRPLAKMKRVALLLEAGPSPEVWGRGSWPRMHTWTIGDVRITRVVERETPTPALFLLPAATPEALERHAAWLRPRFLADGGKIVASVHSLIVESQGRRIIVDTCVGNDKDRPATPFWHRASLPFMHDLTAAGFAPATIDTVVCTHLHTDHVGWNTTWDGARWRPTFPNARYRLVEAEWEYWRREAPDNGDPIADSVQPLFDGGLVDLVAPDTRLTDEVWLESTPGHTPGHVSVRIRSRGVEAVITGDLMHHPVQCAEPEWNSRFDVDAAGARATRRAFLERHADAPILVFGTHFATPSAGHIVRDGAAFRFV
jgi:glyoxylase-like metal-dependent hydrolase (beta-lactamase superfamily II)